MFCLKIRRVFDNINIQELKKKKANIVNISLVKLQITSIYES